MSAPLRLIGRYGQVASAVQRLAPALLPHTPVVVVGRPELDFASATPSDWNAVLAHAINATAVGHLSTDDVFDGSGERPW